MFGGRFFDNIWDPYSVAYAYPRPRYHGPRADHYRVPEDRSNEQPLNKKTVKTIPVTDGGAPDMNPVVKSEDAAATEIQAFYRGYVVRKTQPLQHLKVIESVKGELESLKCKSQEAEQKVKLRTDSKERLRWSEGVMALLLRLDSLQGVHPEVRLIRKAVTKELLGFQEKIDSMSTVCADSNDVISHETTDNSAAPAPEVVGEMEIEDNNVRNVVQDLASGGATENVSDGQNVKSSKSTVCADSNDVISHVSTDNSAAPAPEVMGEMEIEDNNLRNIVQDLASGGATENVSGQNVKSGEDLTSEKHGPHVPLASNDHVINSVAPHSDENGVPVCESMVEMGGSSASDALPEGPMDTENEQLLTMSPAHHMVEDKIEPASSPSLPPEIGNQEVEVETSQSGGSGDNPTLLEEKETTGVDGRIIPARISTQSMALEPRCNQDDHTDALSDRSLLLGVLEENRKLKDVLGKVLEWGKLQNDAIHNLAHRISQLEDQQPPPTKLLHGKERKRERPVDNMERSRRRLEKGRRNKRQYNIVDSEDWPSVESDDYF